MHDLTGATFGRLRVIGFAERRGENSRHYYWRCACECGGFSVVDGGHLTGGHTQSCGCLHAETTAAINRTHGQASIAIRTVEYTAWVGILSRCHNPKNKSFKRYGGRGIVVCDRWRLGEDGKSGFECFFADMGKKPSKELTIERKDSNGNYEPGNCKWTTQTEQQRNRRDSLFFDYHGQRTHLKAICEAQKLPYNTVWQRLNKLGWTLDKSISAPVRVS